MAGIYNLKIMWSDKKQAPKEIINLIIKFFYIDFFGI